MSLFPYPNQRYSSNIGLSLFGMDEVLAENFLLIDAVYGAGSSINVNGVLVTSPNFSSTTPPAPGGDELVTFQVDANGNISAYVPTPAPGGVTSLTGDGVVYNNSASTGAVTLSLISQTKNTFLGAPNGSNGTPTFRALVAADLPTSGTWAFAGTISGNTIFSGTPTSTTNVNAADASAQISTDAFVQNALNLSMGTVPLSITGGTYSFFCQGSGATVVVFASGSISSILTWAGGSGYKVGDVITPQAGNYDAFIVITAIGGVSGTAPTAGTILYGGTGYGTGGAAAGSAAVDIQFTFLLTGVLTSNATFYMTYGTYLTTSQQWIFCNNTTGPYTVTVGLSNSTNTGGSGGRTVVIPQGTNNSRSLLLQTDGEANVDIAGVVNYADLGGTPTIPADTWSSQGNATGALTLANAGYTTTFNQTSAVAWLWANTTVATASTSSAALVASGCSPTASSAVTLNTSASGLSGVAATLLVAIISNNSNSTPGTISDSVGGNTNAWNYLAAQGSTTGNCTRIAYAYATTGGGALATGTSHVFTVAGAACSVAVFAFSGTLTTSAVYDSSNVNYNAASPFTTGSITPTWGGVIVAGWGCNANGLTTAGTPTSFTGIITTPATGGSATNETVIGVYLLGASGSAYNPSFTATFPSGHKDGCAVIASFKANTTNNNSNSPLLTLSGQVYSGSTSISDSWTVQVIESVGSEPKSTLTFAQSGSTGLASMSIPNQLGIVSSTGLLGLSSTGSGILSVGSSTPGDATGTVQAALLQVGGTNLGLSTIGAGNLAIGNGTAGDFSGTVTATQFTIGYTGASISPPYLTSNSTGNLTVNGSSSAAMAFVLGNLGQFHFQQTGSTATDINIDPANGRISLGGFTPDTGISRLGAASLAIGNGTANDVSGNISAKIHTLSDFGSAPTSAGTAGTVGQIVMHNGVLYFCSVTGPGGGATQWNTITLVPIL
jgi:hypothetical protein